MAFAWTVVVAALGVDVGWQPLNSGGMEYIIQIEPDSLDSLLDGRDIVSDVILYQPAQAGRSPVASCNS